MIAFNKINQTLLTINRLSQKLQKHSKHVLGIETTFDDTGVAIVNDNGDVLADTLYTQKEIHLQNRGVNPIVAQLAHRQKLPIAVDEVMNRANMSFREIDALATATHPGLSVCLGEGLQFSKHLIRDHKLPFIPIHHMEAHLLTARLGTAIQFPFLSLLVSGGHCILCIALKLGQYKVLGETKDEPPGAVFDKVARAFKFVEQKQERVFNGRDLEKIAKFGNCHRYKPVVPFSRRAECHCDFSFAGLQTQALNHLQKAKSFQDEADVAAWFQYCSFKHILSKTHRAIVFCQIKNLISDSSATLVVSGGVASNTLLQSGLEALCKRTKTNLVIPPSHLCTDNGIMIAWAGMEYLLKDLGISDDPFNEKYLPKSALGTSIKQEVIELHIKIPKIDYFTV